MENFVVRRSRLTLIIGYTIVYLLMGAFMFALLYIAKEDPTYLDLNFAFLTWIIIFLFFNCFLLNGSFYKIVVEGENIYRHAFLRKTKTFTLNEISGYTSSGGLDIKILNKKNKKMFYVKATDRNVQMLFDKIDGMITTK